jgi:hypothetical protein
MTRRKKRDAREKNTGNTRSGRARSSPETARLGLGTAPEARSGRPGRCGRSRGANGDVPCISASTPHTATAPRAKSPGRLLNERCAMSSSPATRARIAFPADASLSRGEVSPGRAPSPEARIVRVCRTSGRVGQESAAARPRVRGSVGRYVLLAPRRKKCSRKNAISRKGFQSPNYFTKKRLRRSREKMKNQHEETLFFRAFGARAPFTRAPSFTRPTYVTTTPPLRQALLCLLLLLERHPQVPAPHRHRAGSRE